MDVARPELRQRKKRRLWLIVGGLATASLLFASLVLSLGPAVPKVKRETLLIDTVKQGPFLRSVRGTGKLVPREMRWISAETEAYVERILIRPGMPVKADTVIMELTNPKVEDDLRAADSAYSAAESDLIAKRAQLLSDSLEIEASLASRRSEYESIAAQEEAERLGLQAGVVAAVQHKKSEIELKQARNRLRIEEQRVKATRANIDAQLASAKVRATQLANTRALRQREAEALHVKAGLDGVMHRLSVEEGQRVSSGANLARVARPGALMAELRVAESQAKDLAIGQTAQVDTYNGIVRGKVLRIEPAVKDGTVLVEVEFTAPLPAGARPDLSVNGTIEIERLPNALFVGRPINAQRDSETMMFRLNGSDIAERVAVRTGKDSANAIEIRQGLRAGDQVILSDTSAYDGASKLDIE